jgi:hypothetical protein
MGDIQVMPDTATSTPPGLPRANVPLVDPDAELARFAKLERDNCLILQIEADASPHFLPRLWQILDLHAVVPFTISIRLSPPFTTVALEIRKGTPMDQRDLIRDLNRVMSVRRAQLIVPVATHAAPRSQPKPETGTVSKALSHTRRFLGLGQR